MRVRGALHVHSTLSRDGTLPIAELTCLYKRKGYQFIAMGEHAEDLTEPKVQDLLRQSAENSDHEFCVIPGIEFAVTRHLHIVGLGVATLIRADSAVQLINEMHEQDGFAVLAHPKRIRWECPADILHAVDAVEIWNVGYDGKYVPSPMSFAGIRRMLAINPRLLVVAGHDFHRIASFYDVAIEMDVNSLTSADIFRNLRSGQYRIRSRFFGTNSAARTSRIQKLSVWLIGQQLANMRKARSLFGGWSQ